MTLPPLSPTIQALALLRPGAQWTIEGDDLATLQWHDAEQLRPTDAEIIAKASDLEANPPAPVPPSISDRQFFQQLSIDEIISEDDALASNAAVIPPPLMAIINAMPAEQQFAAKMLVSGATVFERDHPMTIAIGTAYGWTATQIDDFFRAAAIL